MEKKAAVIVAEGFEESETLTIVDILRRAEIRCDLVGLISDEVKGAHDIVVKTDHGMSDDLLNYDMVILPGGYGGADAMRNNDHLLALLNKMNDEGRYVCAMCAAPIALERAGLLKDRKYTAYAGYDKKIADGTYLEDIVVQDGNLITSRGPATVYAFAYYLVDVLGGDSLAVKNRMVYFNAFDVKEEA